MQRLCFLKESHGHSCFVLHSTNQFCFNMQLLKVLDVFNPSANKVIGGLVQSQASEALAEHAFGPDMVVEPKGCLCALVL